MIGIIGQGFVGNAVYQAFKNYFKIYTYDINSKLCNSTYEDVIKNDFIFICLPTPMNKDGSCNIDLIENEISKINCRKKTLIIKSTVIPGTVEKWNNKYSANIIFNPEFLTEKNSVNDYKNQNRIILGGEENILSNVLPFFKTVFPSTKIIITNSKTAEMLKYMTNTFLSIKISFSNEVYKISECMGIDYNQLVEILKYDERIGKTHWQVPGPDGDFGYGGHCFPKDLAAFINLTERKGTINNVLKAAVLTNDQVRKNKDWEEMKGRAVT